MPEFKALTESGIWHESEGSDLYLAFSGLPGDFGMSVFEFHKTLSGFCGKKVFLRDLHQAWYLCGLSGEIRGYSRLREMLRIIIEKENPTKLITLGVSSGGFAALLFGKVFGADRSLAFAPQTFVDMPTRESTGERRWGYRLPHLNSCAEPDAPKNLRHVLGQEFNGAHVWFGSSCPKDKPHIDNIRTEGITFYEVDGDEPTDECDNCLDACRAHNIAGFLKQKGTLEDEIRGVL